MGEACELLRSERVKPGLRLLASGITRELGLARQIGMRPDQGQLRRFRCGMNRLVKGP